MNSEETNSYFSEFESRDENVLKNILGINVSLSNKLSYLSRQIDNIPYDYTLKPLLRYKRRIDNQYISIDEERFRRFHGLENYINNGKYYLNMNEIKELEENHEPIHCLNYIPVTDIIINNQKNQDLNNKLSLLGKKNIENGLNWSFTKKQLGKSFKHSNKEINSDSVNSYYTLNEFTNTEDKELELLTHNQYNNQNTESESSYFDFEYQNKLYIWKEFILKSKILKELEKLDKEKKCKITFLKKVMAKSNIDKISNHRDNQNIKYINKKYIFPNIKENMYYSLHKLSYKDPRKYRLTGFLEFYKVNYMGLLEKYNQAKRAYSQTLPRMQMLEIQNNILFEIIGKIHAEDDGITNLLKEFIEIKSFCIHSIMKLKDELGDNYENILNLIIESNSTSEVRPWAKILSGMFNYYEIKVDDTLIQNLNTLYSINKMTQGS